MWTFWVLYWFQRERQRDAHKRRKGKSMMGNDRTLSKRSMLIVLAAALAMAFALSFGMVQTAEAASTSGPYAGYKYDKSKEVNGAGNIQMSTYDARNVKAGYGSFYVWSGNTNLYQDGKNVPAKKAFKKLKGMTYDKKKNTLTLNNVNAPTYRLSLFGMGTGFKLVLKGKNALSSITCEYAYMRDSKGNYKGSYPCSLNISGSGSLVVNKNKNSGAAITVYGSGSASKLAIAKGAKVTLYAYGVSNVISVSTTTAKSASQAISIKGSTAENPYVASQSNQPYTYYEEEGVTILENDYENRALYNYNGQLYYVDSSWNEEEWIDDEPITVTCYELRLVSKVATVGKTVYYTAESSFVTAKASETIAAGTGRVVPSYSSSWMTKVKKGKTVYYARESSKGVSYWDPKTRKTYCSKWDIYKKVATKDGRIFVTFEKTVANNGELPKGYKGIKTNGGNTKTTYTHVIKNNMLTISG